ncbi:mechanosensitive ion channel [Janibacter sp. YB324]|uniref:mechanosensitive ion channel n=1 Tax=Janibacter sp. YB324 TaxID=2761047 RepID=UPI0016269D81|nr:mechanosensitive ion channel [Janibacter sp. YB324]QNF95615.1 mechanosensitive ion channel [Janibacter sp. YB324]
MDSGFFDGVDWPGLLGKALAAVAILVITWLVAMIVKSLFTKLSSKIPALQRAGADGASVGTTLGSIGSLVVWMLGLVAILQVLGLSQVLTPIQGMADGVLGFLPNLIGAGVVFFVGALLAKVVRQLVQTALSALPFDRWLKKAGSTTSSLPGAPQVSPAGPPPPPPGQPAPPQQQTQQFQQSGGQGPAASIPRTLATVVYALIMIVVTIASLQILGIESISRPAEQMLQSIFDAVPVIIAAGIMLALGIFIARFAGDIVEQVLDGVGLDRQIAELDVLPAETKVAPVVAKIVQIAIVLFFAVMAAQLLDFPQITTFLSEVLGLGGKVIFGAAIIAAGLFIANLLAKLLTGVGATIVKYATIVLFVAMGLKYMGIADSIIELGFGALVVGGAAAAALAFGLGGRDAAARTLDKLSAKAEAQSGPTSSGDQQA